MCEPATLTAIAIGTAVVSAGVSAYGQQQQGSYQARVQRQNAQIAENQASLELQAGAAEAGLRRQATSQQIGEARAAAGTSGLELSGSALDTIADARMLSELDVAQVKNNAAREAYGYKVAAANARAQGELAKRSGAFGAATTLIGGAAQAASMASSYKLARLGGPRGTTAGVLGKG